MAGQRRKPAKRRKTTAETTKEQTTSADRISHLPEEILIKILTAAELDTRTVVQTSLFSRSWRNLWKSVVATKLSLEFPDGRIIPEAEQKRFVAFVEGILSFRNREYSHSNEGLDVLSVTINEFPKVPSLVGQIFAHGLAHQARTLRVVALYPVSVLPLYPVSVLPPDLTGMCWPVQNLEISYWDDCRPALRDPLHKFLSVEKLRLYRCSLMESQHLPFGKMTRLTDLEVIKCKLFARALTISGDKLVRVVLVYSDGLRRHSSRLTICAPNLKSFTCKGMNPFRFSSYELPSLECLDIDIDRRITRWWEKKKKMRASLKCFRMFRSFCRAERVKLHRNVITVLTRLPEILETQESPFTRMQCLELHNSRSVLSNRKVFNSLIRYFFDQPIPETSHLDRIFDTQNSSKNDSHPLAV
ncbi:F-box/FBD/LRR-repeat protein At1g16930, partial [Linum grandiflorum]